MWYELRKDGEIYSRSMLFDNIYSEYCSKMTSDERGFDWEIVECVRVAKRTK
jgi:hypothetical protein